MKILDIPQSGKRGLNVSQGGRNGQISRALVIPTNPQTDAQLRIRAFLRSVASTWSNTLTQAQRDAWTAEASQHQSKARLGQSGPLTGFQLYAKINCSLLVIGGAVVSAPPAAPVFDLLPVTGLTITNAAGVITLKLTTTDSPPDGTMLWGAKPCSQGIIPWQFVSHWRALNSEPPWPCPPVAASPWQDIYLCPPAHGQSVWLRRSGAESAAFRAVFDRPNFLFTLARGWQIHWYQAWKWRAG